MALTDPDGQTAQPVVIEGRSMIILYGSETGNSEEIAVELGKMAQRHHFQTVVEEMDSFKLTALLRYSLAIFVTATTGQGDLPKNASKFWRNLRREKLNNTNCLRAVKFAIFGLGDSSYLKFNWAARKLRARLLQLGASEFFEAGEADERHDSGTDTVYLPWYQDLKASILAQYPLPESTQPIPEDVQLPPKYALKLLEASEMTTPTGPHQAAGEDEEERRFLATRHKSAVRTHVDHPRSDKDQRLEEFFRLGAQRFPLASARESDVWERERKGRISVSIFDKDNVLKDHPEKYLLKKPAPEISAFPPSDTLLIPGTNVARVLVNERVTPQDHWQDVRKLELDVTCELAPGDPAPTFYAGSTVTIFPKNYPEDAQTLIELMGWGDVADIPLDFGERHHASAGAVPMAIAFPKKLHPIDNATLRDLLIHNLDITAVPKRSFIRELIQMTKEPMEKERLRELTLSGNEQEYYDYTSRPRRTILELLRDFPGVKIPWKQALNHFEIIRGREFSVCSGFISKTSEDEQFVRIRLEMLAALVEYKTIIRKPRQGLCSRYLKNLPVGRDIEISFNRANTNALYPAWGNHRRPLIAIATGTGIAPIRALIKDRGIFPDPGPVLLFFGCRNKDADYYFREEWENDNSVAVIPAFSRDPVDPAIAKDLDPYDRNSPFSQSKEEGGYDLPEEGPPNSRSAIYGYDAGKNYVQHQIRRHAAEIGEFMNQQPLICVCGNAGKMPGSVRRALLDVLVASKVVGDINEANKFMEDRKKVTYWQECW
ncbi:hypothetical protein OQA88_2814 [Cercophora sp. LCS_1]